MKRRGCGFESRRGCVRTKRIIVGLVVVGCVLVLLAQCGKPGRATSPPPTTTRAPLPAVVIPLPTTTAPVTLPSVTPPGHPPVTTPPPPKRTTQAPRPVPVTTRPAPATTQPPPPAADPDPDPDVNTSKKKRTGNTGHPCLPGERDGDDDGFCGEG